MKVVFSFFCLAITWGMVSSARWVPRGRAKKVLTNAWHSWPGWVVTSCALRPHFAYWSVHRTKDRCWLSCRSWTPDHNPHRSAEDGEAPPFGQSCAKDRQILWIWRGCPTPAHGDLCAHRPLARVYLVRWSYFPCGRNDISLHIPHVVEYD